MAQTGFRPGGPAFSPRREEKITIGSAPKRSKPAAAFMPGDAVVHLTFGRGVILSATPMGSDTLYEVMFDTVGTKRLMATYARLKPAEE